MKGVLIKEALGLNVGSSKYLILMILQRKKIRKGFVIN